MHRFYISMCTQRACNSLNHSFLFLYSLCDNKYITDYVQKTFSAVEVGKLS